MNPTKRPSFADITDLLAKIMQQHCPEQANYDAAAAVPEKPQAEDEAERDVEEYCKSISISVLTKNFLKTQEKGAERRFTLVNLGDPKSPSAPAMLSPGRKGNSDPAKPILGKEDNGDPAKPILGKEDNGGVVEKAVETKPGPPSEKSDGNGTRNRVDALLKRHQESDAERKRKEETRQRV